MKIRFLQGRWIKCFLPKPGGNKRAAVSFIFFIFRFLARPAGRGVVRRHWHPGLPTPAAPALPAAHREVGPHMRGPSLISHPGGGAWEVLGLKTSAESCKTQAEQVRKHCRERQVHTGKRVQSVIYELLFI